MFRGNHPARVDEKGRLKLPAEFKRVVEQSYGTQFYITSKDGRSAEIYPMQEWQKIEEKLAAIPNMNPAKRKFMDRVNYYGQTSEMDAQGRVLLPQILAGTGQAGRRCGGFRGANVSRSSQPRRVQPPMDTNPLTAEDEKALADFGL